MGVFFPSHIDPKARTLMRMDAAWDLRDAYTEARKIKDAQVQECRGNEMIEEMPCEVSVVKSEECL